MSAANAFVISLSQLSMQDLDVVGGKNASLGEMIANLTKAGVKVPLGFATTAEAYRVFLNQQELDRKIHQWLHDLDVNNVTALKKIGHKIRNAIIKQPLPNQLVEEVTQAYSQLAEDNPLCAVAVRSSATIEDLPEASFAGQQETLLNIRGIENVLSAIQEVFSSVFNDRVIAYRAHHHFAHENVALSVCVQKMVRSDIASSGVMFTLDTESGFQDVVLINSSYGLGEMIVQGAVNPDEFYVHKSTLLSKKPAILRRSLGTKQHKMIYKEENIVVGNHNGVIKVNVNPRESQQFSLTDNEITKLAEQAIIIENHYGRPMDIEWAKDGVDQQLYILQARPETVKSRAHANIIERYYLNARGPILAQGRSIGQKIGSGKAKILDNVEDMDQFNDGDVLIADMTDPDWEPIMKRASAIITNRGGRTCHAAIIARELGIPAVVGTHSATKKINVKQEVTVSCAEGDVGYVYEGKLPFEVRKIELANMPKPPLKIMMNVANPDRAFDFQFLPNAGIGLARLEFIISQMIGVHPNACIAFNQLPTNMKEQILLHSSGYASPREFYIKKLTEGVATLAAAFHPHKVIVRMSDFKSNEYANLLGGDLYEPKEENPMIGFRGASRYVSHNFKACFGLECEALRYVRDTMGLTNVEIMIPFVRTITETKAVLEVMSEFGLKRGTNGLRVIMMCEVPSNAILAEQFLEHFDGFSIGSNDLTQLTLGLDRDSGIVSGQFDERDEAVKSLMSKAIQACKSKGKYIGICGQGPSDHPDLAKWLLEQGIESLSLNPDAVLETWLFLSKH